MEKVENKLKEPTASDQMLTFADGKKRNCLNSSLDLNENQIFCAFPNQQGEIDFGQTNADVNRLNSKANFIK